MLKDYDGKFSVDDFTAFIRGNDLARTNQYEVIIPGILDGPETTLCDAASIPGINILTKNVKYMGPAYQRGMSIDYGGAGINLSFYIDGSAILLQKFNMWMHKVISKNYIVQYDKDYKKNILISLLRKDGINQPESAVENFQGKIVATDSAGKNIPVKRNAPAIYGIKIYDAFPISMSPIMLDSSPNSGIAKLNVTFAYSKWEEDVAPEPKTEAELYDEKVAAGYTPPPSQQINNALGITGMATQKNPEFYKPYVPPPPPPPLPLGKVDSNTFRFGQ